MRWILLPLLLLLTTPVQAERLAIVPSAADVGIRFYGLGFVPIDGKYTRFAGSLAYDPAQRGRCQVDMSIEVASLTMGNARIREDVLGPEFMDAARFPTLTFAGACQGQSLNGDLTMHGVTAPLALSLERDGDIVTATGRLRRATWGITAHPLIGGSTIRIQVRLAAPLTPIARADAP